MSLNAVQQYVAHALLDGLASPFLPNLTAVVQPPVFADAATGPWGFVWAGRANERRQTAPRQQARTMGGPIQSGGYQKATWSIEVALVVVLDQEAPFLEQAFPCLIDAVRKAIATSIIPTVIEDPATNQQTQLLTMGETMDTDYAAVRVTGAEGQSLLRYGATVTATAEEKVDWTGGVVVP